MFYMLIHVVEVIHQIQLIYSTFHAHKERRQLPYIRHSDNANNLIEAAQNDKNSAWQLWEKNSDSGNWKCEKKRVDNE